ncbi:MAG: AIPR family protein, partial [Deltaproteobacteria bacterium]|nr:AIPR family protein [Deltaproteobacteria bacterium]
AKEARFNNQTNLLEVDVEDKEIHGLMDGGHTYLQLEKFKQCKDERQLERQFVKVEILTGLTKDKIVDVVAGRNTSNQVKEVSLAELDGAFKEVKQILANQSYANLIAYSEYEEMKGVDDKMIAKPISVIEILKCLICMDAENFNEEKHPFRIATGDDKVIQHFKKYKQEMKLLYPLLPSILQLWDTIYKNFVSLYNASGGKAGSIGGADNRFFKELKKTQRTLHFIADTSAWAFADSLRLPVLAGFRAALTKTKGGFTWKTEIDPSDFFLKEVGSILARIVCQSLIDTQDSTRTSRTESVWRHCYTEVELALYKKSSKAKV